MNDRTLGIIVKQSDYKENDALVNVLSFDYGLLTFVARGVRKPGSKNIAALYPFSESEFLFDYVDNRDMFALHSATLKSIYKNIQTNLTKSAVSNVFSELIMIISKDEQLDKDIYNLLKNCLKCLNDYDDIYLPLALFLASILDYLGISPEVDECCICGSKQVNSISVEDGGFVCEKCNSNKALDPKFLKQFRLLNKATYENIDILKDYGPYSFSHCEYLYSFLNTYLSLNLKSWTFLCDVLNM